MAEAKRDEQTKVVVLGYDAVSGLPIEVAVDPITGYLLAELEAVSEDTPPVPPTALRRDQNTMMTWGGLNESTGLVEPIYIDADNGGIRAEVTVQ